MLKLLIPGMYCLLVIGSLGAAEPLEAIKSVEIGKNRELLVNGKPYFPIMSWLQTPRRFAELRALGFNTFNCANLWPAQEVLDNAKATGGYAMIGWDKFEPAVKNHPALLTYTVQDEPDMGVEKGKPAVPAEKIAVWSKGSKGNDPSRPVFLNYCGTFMNSQGGAGAGVKEYYQASATAADILCFDIYPIYQQNRDDRLIWVADGVSELQAIGGPAKPIWAWIESSKGSKWISLENQKDVTPEITRSEVWMAIIRGATGIGYFTHAWRPSETDFAPTEAMQKEIKHINEQIARLAPAILSAPPKRKATITFEGGLHGEVMLKENGGSIWLFANNLDMKDLGERKDKVKATYRGGKATLKVEGLKAGSTIEVVDEDRKITSADGSFSDSFEPLAVHIYAWKD